MLGVLEGLSRAFDQSNPISPNAMGFDAEYRVPSHVKSELQSLARLPGNVSRQTVIQEAYDANKTEAAAKLFQKYVQLRQRRMRATARLYQSAAQHQQGVLRTNEQMMNTDERYGKFIEEHMLNAGISKQSLDGYQAGFQNARTLVG